MEQLLKMCGEMGVKASVECDEYFSSSYIFRFEKGKKHYNVMLPKDQFCTFGVDFMIGKLLADVRTYFDLEVN